MESTSRGRVQQTRRHTVDRWEFLGVHGNRAREKPLGIRMDGFAEDAVDRTEFGELSGVHDGDAVAHLRDDAEVVRDEDERHRIRTAEITEDLEDLRLDNHVQGGRGLVCDEHLRIQDKAERDHDALSHPSRELVGVVFDAGLWNPHRSKHFDGPSDRLRGRNGSVVGANRLHEVILDRHERVEARHRVLEDQCDLLSTETTVVRLREADQLPPSESEMTRDLHPRRQDAENRLA